MEYISKQCSYGDCCNRSIEKLNTAGGKNSCTMTTKHFILTISKGKFLLSRAREIVPSKTYEIIEKTNGPPLLSSFSSMIEKSFQPPMPVLQQKKLLCPDQSDVWPTRSYIT